MENGLEERTGVERWKPCWEGWGFTEGECRAWAGKEMQVGSSNPARGRSRELGPLSLRFKRLHSSGYTKRWDKVKPGMVTTVSCGVTGPDSRPWTHPEPFLLCSRAHLPGPKWRHPSFLTLGLNPILSNQTSRQTRRMPRANPTRGRDFHPATHWVWPSAPQGPPSLTTHPQTWHELYYRLTKP